jgi:hypothetical protein
MTILGILTLCVVGYYDQSLDECLKVILLTGVKKTMLRQRQEGDKEISIQIKRQFLFNCKQNILIIS